MKNTGQILKEKRESLNLTLSEVALSTKINPKILAAMESGDQQNLPAQTFLKGFVRSYAAYLKLDQDAVIKSFNQEMGTAAPVKTAESHSSPAMEGRTEPGRVERERENTRSHVETETSTAMKSAAVALIVILIGVIFGVRELIQKYQKETVVEKPKDLKATPIAESAQVPAEPVKETAAETPSPPTVDPDPTLPVTPLSPVTAQEPLIIQSTPEAIAALATPIIPDELKFPDAKPEEKKPAEVKAEPPKVEAKVEPPKSEPPKVEPPKVEPAKVEAKPAEVQATAPLINPGSKNEIILEALDNVEIRAVIKGQTRKIALGPTQVHTIRTDGSVQFDFSDGGAVNIIVNGRERGVPGDLGKPKQVQIP